MSKSFFSKIDFPFFFSKSILGKHVTSQKSEAQRLKDMTKRIYFKKPVVLLVEEGPSDGGEAVRTLFIVRTKPKNNTMVLPTQAKGPPPQKKKTANANRASRMDMTPEI